MTGHFEKFTIRHTASSFDVEFKNKDTGAVINLNIPKQGIFESDPNREITQQEVKNLGEQIAEVLDTFLD